MNRRIFPAGNLSPISNGRRLSFGGLPFNLLLYVCNFVSLRDWCCLAQVSRKFNHIVEHLWLNKTWTILENDVQALFPGYLCKFFMPDDNLWPQRLYKSDSFLSLAEILDAYKEVEFLFSRCTRLESLELMFSFRSSENHPVGRSFFRLLENQSFNNLYYLNLSLATFTLADFEFSATSFPLIKVLKAEKCRIYISRRRTLVEENDRILRRILHKYTKKRPSLTQGIKVFLVTLARTFESLEIVNTGETQFLSTGCIVYSYGTEEVGANYRLLEYEKPVLTCLNLFVF